MTQGVGFGLVARGFGQRDVAIILLLDEEPRAIPALLPVLLGERSMEGIRARLGHDGDGGAAGVPDRGIEVHRFDLEFLNGGGERQVGGAVAVARIGHAIDRPIIAPDVARIMRFRGAAQGIHAVVAPVAARLNTGDELDEHQRAVVERGQILYAAALHHAARAHTAGIQQGRFRGNRNSLRNLADGQIQIDLDARAHRQNDARAYGFPESRHLRQHLVITCQQQIGFVISGVIRFQCHDRVGIGVGHDHGSAGDYRALRVRYAAKDHAAGLLPKPRGGYQDQQRGFDRSRHVGTEGVPRRN